MTELAETIGAKEAATRLGVSKNTVIRWYHAGKLDGYQLGDQTSPIRIYTESLEAFIAEKTQGRRPPGADPE